MASALGFIPLLLLVADPLRDAVVGGSAGAVGAFLAAALLGIILHTLRRAGGRRRQRRSARRPGRSCAADATAPSAAATPS